MSPAPPHLPPIACPAVPADVQHTAGVSRAVRLLGCPDREGRMGSCKGHLCLWQAFRPTSVASAAAPMTLLPSLGVCMACSVSLLL